MSWNHRVVTSAKKGIRLFEIAEVYYNNNIPYSYCSEGTYFTVWGDINDLKETYDKMASAFEKPIIDLDNFPNEFKNE